MALKPIAGGTNGMFRRNAYFQSNAVFTGTTAEDGYAHRGDQSSSITGFYYPRLDRMFGRTQADNDDFVHWDPLFIDGSAPVAGVIDATSAYSTFAVGEWDKDSNVQKIYGGTNTGQIPMEELSPVDLSVIDTAPFPNLTGSSAAGRLNQENYTPAAPNNNALAKSISAVSNRRIGNIVVFESAGFCIQFGIGVRTGDFVWHADATVQMDLNTGECVAMSDPGFHTTYKSSPEAGFNSPPFFGDTFTLSHGQFIPDEDSILTSPKGLLAMSSIPIDASGTEPAGSVRSYVKLVEFNPDSVPASPGSPTRVHGRVILFSRFDMIEDDTPENGGTGDPSTPTPQVFYHPPTQTWNYYGYSTDSAPVDDIVHGQFSNAIALSEISNPTAETVIETGRTVTFGAAAFGDLGEAVANLGIDWTLQRASTLDEILDTSGAPATTNLANAPIDEHIVEIRFNGTLLTAGVDYNITNAATGEITWAGSHAPPAASGYTATYTHRGVAVAGPFGNLLTTFSKTDESGKAVARVTYDDDDDLVGMVDVITATEAT